MSAPTEPGCRTPKIVGDRIEIPLTKGYVAVVDLDCPGWILLRKWRALPHRGTVYAVREEWIGPGRRDRRPMYLHREILGLAFGDGMQVDHEDGDGLNNRRENLRACRSPQNQANKGSQSGAVSRFRGVSRNRNRWRARLVWTDADGVEHTDHIGTFDTEEEAANAYNAHAVTRLPAETLPFFRPNEVASDPR